ncbi:MAG TPA: DUF4124 domain-containing protein [Gammaproteobacteria bacterium]|nr:DUF4124 domain-containing protein [Gammaproteobacteria bacterium]
MNAARVSLACGVLLAALAGAALAAQVYRWVDKDGHVHYSEMPPPTTGAAAAAATSLYVAPADPTGLKNEQSLEKQQAGQQKAAAEAQQQAAADAAKKAQQQKQCSDMRDQLAAMQNSRKISLTDQNGQTQYYSGDDLLKQQQLLQDRISKDCGAG